MGNMFCRPSHTVTSNKIQFQYTPETLQKFTISLSRSSYVSFTECNSNSLACYIQRSTAPLYNIDNIDDIDDIDDNEAKKKDENCIGHLFATYDVFVSSPSETGEEDEKYILRQITYYIHKKEYQGSVIVNTGALFKHGEGTNFPSGEYRFPILSCTGDFESWNNGSVTISRQESGKTIVSITEK